MRHRDVAGLEFDLQERRLVVRAVVAIAEEHGPGPVCRLGNDRLADDLTDEGAVGAVPLPQQLHRCGIRHVQCVDRFREAASRRADENRSPARGAGAAVEAVEIDVGNRQLAIVVELVRRRRAVVRIAQILEVAGDDDRARQIRVGFLARQRLARRRGGLRIEAVQHAVVGRHVDALLS